MSIRPAIATLPILPSSAGATMSSLDTSVSVVVLFVRGTPDHLQLVVAKSCDELLEGVCLPNIELPRPHGRVLRGIVLKPAIYTVS